MRDLVCDTSVIQYLHQLELLRILRELGGEVCVPEAVRQELAVGRGSDIDLPDLEQERWIKIRRPKGESDVRLISDMGPGEAEVLMLALESPGLVPVLDDALARRRADLLGIPFTGTLGLLVDAKKKGLVSSVGPLLDRLQSLGFRLSSNTRDIILEAAAEL